MNCSDCGTPLPTGGRACPNCGALVSSPASNIPTIPVSHPQAGATSISATIPVSRPKTVPLVSQASSASQPEPYGSNPYDIPPPPPSQPPRRNPWILITILAIIILGSSISYAGYQFSLIATQTFSPTATAPAGPTSTTGTPSGTISPPLVIKKNVNMPCATCDYAISLFWQQMTIDHANQTTTFYFKITSNSNSRLNVEPAIQIQDDSGNTTQGPNDQIISLSPSQVVYIHSTIPLDLKSGVHYVLTVSLDYSGYRFDYKQQDFVL